MRAVAATATAFAPELEIVTFPAWDCLPYDRASPTLRVMAERVGRVQTREQLMQAVRGEDLEEFDRSIDVHISRIRAAIEDDPKHPRRIRTVRAVGYVFAPLPEEAKRA